ncbi:hypothetical protein EJB05_12507, partial [Eragrostis curvula]
MAGIEASAISMTRARRRPRSSRLLCLLGFRRPHLRGLPRVHAAQSPVPSVDTRSGKQLVKSLGGAPWWWSSWRLILHLALDSGGCSFICGIFTIKAMDCWGPTRMLPKIANRDCPKLLIDSGSFGRENHKTQNYFCEIVTIIAMEFWRPTKMLPKITDLRTAQGSRESFSINGDMVVAFTIDGVSGKKNKDIRIPVTTVNMAQVATVTRTQVVTVTRTQVATLTAATQNPTNESSVRPYKYESWKSLSHMYTFEGRAPAAHPSEPSPAELPYCMPAEEVVDNIKAHRRVGSGNLHEHLVASSSRI